MRVLVVEDEKKTASFVRKALEGEGFAVDVCQRGDEALAAAAEALKKIDPATYASATNSPGN